MRAQSSAPEINRIKENTVTHKQPIICSDINLQQFTFIINRLQILLSFTQITARNVSEQSFTAAKQKKF